ncbi:DNA-binding PadR family transcriptional regulator [Mumia flava]|uniref:DNA-binding PadR family transcriptional regulator n=1 Tax=Mumia flava TaxID=1348852 RepID=A0A0B2BHL2_9ACTN|nr:PadR family transcriptional regulator [Mumia flava]PJJ58454.1 DNA-binding PadR family transcriptional regulator [Mumia flava]
MAALTPLAISTIALLAERPMHPYEMLQLLIERRDDRLLKVRAGSLYHTIERLERDQLVEAVGTERSGNRPERTTYAMTDAGRDALRSAVTDLLRTPVNEYPRFPFALSEAHNLPADEVITLLAERRDALAADEAELESVIVRAHERGVHEAYWFVADYLLTVHRAELAWIDRLLDRLRTKDLAWPHPQ